MMVVPDFGAAHAAEKALGIVRMRLSLIAHAVSLLMVDAMQSVASVKRIPASRLIGIERRFRRNPLANEGQRVGLVAEHARQRLAAALADDDDDLAFAGAVDGLAAILAILAAIG